MILEALLFTIFVSQNYVHCVDLNSVFPRLNCYPTEQPNCNQNFIDLYPELSKSATNLTDADTFFWLFTRRNRDKPENLHKCGGRLPPYTQFDPAEELIVIVNAFVVGFCDVAHYREWLDQILQRGNYNVLVVDYTWGCRIDYGTSILNIKIVAKQTVIVLNNIQRRTKIKNSAISIVGHSLGGQLAGLIGKDFHVHRITALDPAGPGFNAKIVPPEDRLDMSDADLVEVWHCNMGECLTGFGTPDDVGHVNFYINGGTVQRGCRKHLFIALAKLDILYALMGFLVPGDCAHNHCTQYYRASINPGNCQYVGVKCESESDFNAGRCTCGENGENCLVMGFDTDKYIEGPISSPQKYYLNTTDTCPYCEKNPSYLDGFIDPYGSVWKK